MSKSVKYDFDGMLRRIQALERAVIMKDPYSHGWRGGSSEDVLRGMDVGVAVYAILKHMQLYPETVVRNNEINLAKWR